MSQNLADRESDSYKLRHDFANDIGSLKMNVEALRLIREDPDEFEQVLQVMKDTISLLEARIKRNLNCN